MFRVNIWNEAVLTYFKAFACFSAYLLLLADIMSGSHTLLCNPVVSETVVIRPLEYWAVRTWTSQ